MHLEMFVFLIYSNIHGGRVSHTISYSLAYIRAYKIEELLFIKHM